jgi:hydrogenase small subunit
MSIHELKSPILSEITQRLWTERFGFEREDIESAYDKKRLPLFWISAQVCTGCKESFIRSAFPGKEELFLNWISLEYSELLSISSGDEIESHRNQIMDVYNGKYILVIEAVSLKRMNT